MCGAPSAKFAPLPAERCIVRIGPKRDAASIEFR